MKSRLSWILLAFLFLMGICSGIELDISNLTDVGSDNEIIPMSEQLEQETLTGTREVRSISDILKYIFGADKTLKSNSHRSHSKEQVTRSFKSNPSDELVNKKWIDKKNFYQTKKNFEKSQNFKKKMKSKSKSKPKSVDSKTDCSKSNSKFDCHFPDQDSAQDRQYVQFVESHPEPQPEMFTSNSNFMTHFTLNQPQEIRSTTEKPPLFPHQLYTWPPIPTPTPRNDPTIQNLHSLADLSPIFSPPLKTMGPKLPIQQPLKHPHLQLPQPESQPQQSDDDIFHSIIQNHEHLLPGPWNQGDNPLASSFIYDIAPPPTISKARALKSNLNSPATHNFESNNLQQILISPLPEFITPKLKFSSQLPPLEPRVRHSKVLELTRFINHPNYNNHNHLQKNSIYKQSLYTRPTPTILKPVQQPPTSSQLTSFNYSKFPPGLPKLYPMPASTFTGTPTPATISLRSHLNHRQPKQVSQWSIPSWSTVKPEIKMTTISHQQPSMPFSHSSYPINIITRGIEALGPSPSNPNSDYDFNGGLLNEEAFNYVKEMRERETPTGGASTKFEIIGKNAANENEFKGYSLHSVFSY